MKLGNPIEVSEDVYQIRVLGGRVTVIRSGKDVVLVDTGIKGSRPYLISGLNALGISTDRIKLIVISHYHPDHSGGLRSLLEVTDAKMAAHSGDAFILSGHEVPPSPYANSILAKIAAPLLGKFYSVPVQIDHILQDGDFLPVGEEIKIVHIPGHTAGMICLYLPVQKLLIAGDALQLRMRRLGLPSKSVTRDFTQATESLHKLKHLDFETICFSHFPPLRDGARHSLINLLTE